MTERDGSSRDRGDWGADPELRALLRAGDPAHSLPPRLPDDLDRLVSAVLAADAAGVPDGLDRSGPAPVERRSGGRARLPLMVAAAAVVAVSVGGAVLANRDGDATPVATPSRTTTPSTSAPAAPAQPAQPAPSSAAPSAAGTTVLQVPAVTEGRCMAPNVGVLAGQQVAFEGSVTAVDGSQVTLAPTAVFAGDVTDTVQIQAPGQDLSSLLSAVSFEVGRTYLVSATDGQVSLCGLSAQASPELRTLYEEAFGG